MTGCEQIFTRTKTRSQCGRHRSKARNGIRPSRRLDDDAERRKKLRGRSASRKLLRPQGYDGLACSWREAGGKAERSPSGTASARSSPVAVKREGADEHHPTSKHVAACHSPE